MNDPIHQLSQQIKEFCDEREWDPFHGPKDLAIGAVTEASELLEHFRFQSDEQIANLLNNETSRKAIGEELADVLFFILRFAQKYEFDLYQCFQEKMQKNARKYPVSEFKGKNHKSTHS
ncbi:MAG: nucleotide pyrophosphohydrolase [Pseudomonadota bacterium]